MTCNLASSYFLFNSNKSSFVSAAFYLVSLSPTTPHHSDRILADPLACSLTLFFHQRPLHSILTSVVSWDCWVQLHCPLTRFWFWWSFQHWTSICQRAKPPLIAEQNTNTPQCCSFGLQAAYMNLRKSQWRQSSRRTSEGKPEDIFSVKYDLVSLAVFCDIVMFIIRFQVRSWRYIGQKQATKGPSGWGRGYSPLTLKWFRICYFKVKRFHIVAVIEPQVKFSRFRMWSEIIIRLQQNRPPWMSSGPTENRNFHGMHGGPGGPGGPHSFPPPMPNIGGPPMPPNPNSLPPPWMQPPPPPMGQGPGPHGHPMGRGWFYGLSEFLMCLRSYACSVSTKENELWHQNSAWRKSLTSGFLVGLLPPPMGMMPPPPPPPSNQPPPPPSGPLPPWQQQAPPPPPTSSMATSTPLPWQQSKSAQKLYLKPFRDSL